MKKTQQYNSCKNCKYFLHYYIKKEKGYRETGLGHCAKRLLSSGKTKNFPFDSSCEYWTLDDRDAKIEKNIQAILDDIYKKLDEISLILQK